MMTARGMSFLSSGVSAIRDLLSLEIRCPDETKGRLWSPVLQAARVLPQLTRVKWKVSGKDESLSGLCHAISCVTGLESLSLEVSAFASEYVVGQGLAFMGESIARLARLTTLHLILNVHHATEHDVSRATKGVASLGRSLATLPNVVDFIFDTQVKRNPGRSNPSIRAFAVLLEHQGEGFAARLRRELPQIDDEPLVGQPWPAATPVSLSTSYTEDLESARKCMDQLLGDAPSDDPPVCSLEHQPSAFSAQLQSAVSSEQLELALSQCSTLESLDLDLQRIPFDLSACAQHMTHLETLQLNLDVPATASLGMGLSQLGKLKHLDLSLRRSGDELLASLGQGVAQAHFLQHVSLRIRGMATVNDREIALLVSCEGGLGRLESLQHLDLDLGCCESIGDDGVLALATCLSELQGLQHFGVAFFNCFKEDEVREMHTFLGTLNLAHMATNDCRISKAIGDAGTSALWKSLATLTRLRVLKLCTSSSAYTQQSAFQLEQSLSQLVNLQCLSLDFFCPVIGADLVAAIGRAVVTLNLHSFRLVLMDCLKASEGALASLTEGVASCTQLTHLMLCVFEVPAPAASAFLQSLSDSLVWLPSLQHVFLAVNKSRLDKTSLPCTILPAQTK